MGRGLRTGLRKTLAFIRGSHVRSPAGKYMIGTVGSPPKLYRMLLVLSSAPTLGNKSSPLPTAVVILPELATPFSVNIASRVVISTPQPIMSFAIIVAPNAVVIFSVASRVIRSDAPRNPTSPVALPTAPAIPTPAFPKPQLMLLG